MSEKTKGRTQWAQRTRVPLNMGDERGSRRKQEVPPAKRKTSVLSDIFNTRWRKKGNISIVLYVAQQTMLVK